MTVEAINQSYEIQKIKHEAALKIVAMLGEVQKQVDALDGDGGEVCNEIMDLVNEE